MEEISRASTISKSGVYVSIPPCHMFGFIVERCSLDNKLFHYDSPLYPISRSSAVLCLSCDVVLPSCNSNISDHYLPVGPY